MDRNSGVINTGSIGGNVTVIHNIGAAPLTKDGKDELVRLEAELRASLAALQKKDAESAEAVRDSLDEIIAKIGKEQPNKRSIEVSAKGLLGAASAVEALMPVATKIIGLIGTAYGFAT